MFLKVIQIKEIIRKTELNLLELQLRKEPSRLNRILLQEILHQVTILILQEITTEEHKKT